MSNHYQTFNALKHHVGMLFAFGSSYLDEDLESMAVATVPFDAAHQVACAQIVHGSVSTFTMETGPLAHITLEVIPTDHQWQSVLFQQRNTEMTTTLQCAP